jgi:diguanylate cyclase (GGDEF)-like protein
VESLVRLESPAARRTTLMIAPLAIIMLALVDRVTGPVMSLAVFYLLPVAAVACFVGRLAGLAAATVCGALWFMDVTGSIPQSMPLSVVAWMAVERVTFFILVSYLISVLKGYIDTQRQLATTDEMTGVANRRALLTQIAAEIARAQRSGAPITLAFLDLDNLKTINDRFGHAAGDRALQVTARTIADTVRRSDLLARVGGDEFALLLPETDEQAADAVIRKVRARLAQTMHQAGWDLTVSIGVATFHRLPANADEMLNTADRLQYQIKHNGKNGVLATVIGTPMGSPPAMAA